MRELGADDDLVSEIIKYERRSLEPINCAGFKDGLIKADHTMRVSVIVPLMASVEVALKKAENAYTRWMNYMSGVIWGLVTSLVPLVRANGLHLYISFQERGRIQEVLDMAPYPFRWMSLVPSRPKSRKLLFGEFNENTSGRPTSRKLLFGEFNETTYFWNDPG